MSNATRRRYTSVRVSAAAESYADLPPSGLNGKAMRFPAKDDMPTRKEVGLSRVRIRRMCDVFSARRKRAGELNRRIRTCTHVAVHTVPQTIGTETLVQTLVVRRRKP